eukprot:12532078-Heterocapsa_arctica.AAC.1
MDPRSRISDPDGTPGSGGFGAFSTRRRTRVSRADEAVPGSSHTAEQVHDEQARGRAVRAD